jgi:alpha-L-rhamnosidase
MMKKTCGNEFRKQAKATTHPDDISWTSAYPLISHWLYQYYGDLGAARDHWPTLKRYVDGQRRQMLAGPDGQTDEQIERSTLTSSNDTLGQGSLPPSEEVPNFYSCGDWCAIEARDVATPNTGPPAAAANFILAVEAMVALADALGETADAEEYGSWLAPYRKGYDASYWNSSLESYGKTALEIQTMSTVSIGAGAVPEPKLKAVRAALLADIAARGTHLTVGATGQKWLLRTLTDGGAEAHDVALGIASQDTFPGWGYWVSQGATTCWESWPGIGGPAHPVRERNLFFAPFLWFLKTEDLPRQARDKHRETQKRTVALAKGVKGRPINPPTHNHIFRECDNRQLTMNS